jgi:hypothetical protein
MAKANSIGRTTAKIVLALGLAIGATSIVRAQVNGRQGRDEKVLYVWAGDQAHVAPDFLAVINFDERSSEYGSVIKTVPVPPPGNIGNEPHNCVLNSTKTILVCGGLLSVLKGQNGIFFFDVADALNPRFVFSTKAVESSFTDGFLPTGRDGFLITQMGAADGTAPGRVAEFDGNLHSVINRQGSITTSLFQEWPTTPPQDGFNPHGISSRPDLNLMMTSDFILPASTLSSVPGPPILRDSVRIWDYSKRTITKTIQMSLPDGPAQGAVDVKMLPKDGHGYGYAAGMFDGHIYLIDPIAGTAVAAFNCATVTPHVETPVDGGMLAKLVTPQSGDRLIFGLFQAGQVGLLDTTDRAHLTQLSVVSFGLNTGPHNLLLSSDDNRLVVSDYFLSEDTFGIGKIQFEGDHKIRVVKVTHDALTVDTRFNLDFNTAFSTGPARPHGLAMK